MRDFLIVEFNTFENESSRTVYDVYIARVKEYSLNKYLGRRIGMSYVMSQNMVTCI